MQGANWVARGTRRVAKERHCLSCQRGDLRPGAMSWPVTRTSVIPVDRPGAAPGGRGRETAVAPRCAGGRREGCCSRQLAK